MEFKNQERNHGLSHEAHFQLSEHINKQNLRCWSDSDPQEVHAILFIASELLLAVEFPPIVLMDCISLKKVMEGQSV